MQKMSQIRVLAATLIIFSQYTSARALNNPIHNFLIDNGHRYVDIVYNSSQWHGFTLTDAFVTRLHIGKIGKGHLNSFGVFVFDPKRDDLEAYLALITQRQIKTSLLLVLGSSERDGTSFFQDILSNLQATAFFYIALPVYGSTSIIWHQVISIKSGSVFNHLRFDSSTYRIIETFDLQGHEITATSLTWAPYLTIDGCNEFGLKCAQNKGYLIDFMDKLSIEFNFTYVSQKNVDNDWGTEPKSGPYNVNGTWGGVWGDVIYKHYDMILAPWLWTSARNELFTCVPLLQLGNMLAMKQQNSKIDFGFFTRAFVGDTLIYIIFMAGAAVFLILIGNLYGLDEEKNSIKIMTFICWIFFILVNSFYSGILTMFFTTTSSVSFNTVSDAIQAYPSWRFMFLDGYQGWVYNTAQRGDPDFMSLWQRYQDNPEQTTFDSIKNGLEFIESGPNVIFLDRNMLLGHLKSNPTSQEIHMINLRQYQLSTLFLYKNSPLSPMLQKAVRSFRETGLEGQLYFKWFAKYPEIDRSDLSEQINVTIGQMVSIFTILLALFVIATIVLCGEISLKRFHKKVSVHGQGMFQSKKLFSYFDAFL